MLEIGQIPEQTQGILDRNLTKLKEDAARNMQSNDQVVTGKTLNSLRVEASGNIGTLYGADHIDTLEVGISPERSRQDSWTHVFAGLFRWVQNRGFIYDMSQSSAFAVKATENQREFGSRLFRQGGGKNVYSAEIDPMTEQIKNELGDVFLNVKIVR